MGIGAWKYFAPAYHPPVDGSLVYTELPGQREDLDLYFQKQTDSQICVHEFFARDDSHIFLEMMCGEFRLKKGEVDIIGAHRMERNVEYRPSPFIITGFTNPEDGEYYGTSLVRMFPEKVYQDFVVYKGTDRYSELLKKRIRARLENL